MIARVTETAMKVHATVILPVILYGCDTLPPLLTYSMEKSPSWEANRFVASQEISRILLNLNVRYRIHNCPYLSLSWASPIKSRPPTSHFMEIHPNIILPSKPGSPQ
jgi:hypothetical protein